MIPLRITATLDSAVAFHHQIHLDALIMSAVATRDNVPPAAIEAELVPLDIPVQRSSCGRYHLATIGFCEVEARELKYINRRYPLEQAQWIGEAKIKRVNLSAGPQKMFRIPIETKLLRGDKVTWWCVGLPVEIEALLMLVTGLGKRRAVGLGAIREWLVEPCDPWPGFPVLSADGEAMRNLPLDTPGLKTFDLAHERVEPPFWMHAGRVEMARPVQT